MQQALRSTTSDNGLFKSSKTNPKLKPIPSNAREAQENPLHSTIPGEITPGRCGKPAGLTSSASRIDSCANPDAPRRSKRRPQRSSSGLQQRFRASDKQIRNLKRGRPRVHPITVLCPLTEFIHICVHPTRFLFIPMPVKKWSELNAWASGHYPAYCIHNYFLIFHIFKT
jgi:hypothetical protein